MIEKIYRILERIWKMYQRWSSRYVWYEQRKLQDLLIFISSHDDKYTTLKEYVDRMGETKEILYIPAENIDVVKALPKMEKLKEQGREVLILTDKIDEFTLMAMRDYSGKEFKIYK